MPKAPASRNPLVLELERQRDLLRRQQERDQRVLSALYNISLVCRERPDFRAIFEAIARELAAVFSFDAAYIAFCDERPEHFRCAYLVDEGAAEYLEELEYGYLTGSVVRSRQPLLFRDLVVEREPGQPRVAFGNAERRSRAWLGVPLLVGDEAVGVISIQSYQVGIYAEPHVDLLQRMANVIAVALENVALLDRQGRLGNALATQVAARTEEIVALSAIAAGLVERRPIGAILERALDVVIDLFRLDAGNVRLLDGPREHLVLYAQRGFSADYVARTARSPLASSPIREVVETGRPTLIASGWRRHYEQQRSVTRIPLEIFPPFESSLVLPLAVGSVVTGTLTLFGFAPRSFDDHELSLAQSVANQIAVIVENSRLLDERERQIGQLRALGEVGRAASTAQDLRTLLRQVHDALRGFIPLDVFSLVVVDPERGAVVDGLTVDEGVLSEYWVSEPPPPRSLTARIIRTGEALRFGDIPAEIAAHPDIEGVVTGGGRAPRSWLGVPLRDRDGRIIGQINVQSYAAHQFSSRDESFLNNVAAQVALHVQNVRLLTQRERQIAELEAIGQIGKLVTASYDLDRMLDEIYRVFSDLLGASVFALLVLDPESALITNAVFVEGGAWVPMDVVGRPVDPATLSGWILAQREPLLFQDIAAQRHELLRRGIEPRAVGPTNVVRSWAGVPVVARDGELIGVLCIQDYRPYRFDGQTIDFLSQVASHLSLGVQKVRLFAAEQEQRRTADTLREMARVLSSSFDPDEVLRLVLGELLRLIPYDTASIMLLDGPQLRMVAARGRTPEVEPRSIILPLEGSAAGEVVRRREALLYVAGRDEMPWMRLPTSANIHSWLGVPLAARGRVLGVLNIDSRAAPGAAAPPRAFTERDVEVARSFGNHAALAIENARLYQESVARVEQELEIARRIQANLFPRELPGLDGLAIAARCVPARETGGDFYDAVDLGARVGVIVGDVSGKSLPAAMLMAAARSTSRSEARNHETPWVVLTETNRWLVDDVPRNSFVALSYALVDPARRTMAIASGGQLTPLLRRADGETRFLETPAALPLGISPTTEYAQVELALAAGDTLVFYTDGIVEAHDRGRNLFGFERLEQIVGRWGHLAPEALIERILAEVHAFAEGLPPHDDMTIVVVRVA